MKKKLTAYAGKIRKTTACTLGAAIIMSATAMAGGPGGSSSSSSVSWTGATEITSATTTTGETYVSTTASQNAILINTASAVTLNSPTVTKSGGTSAGDSESFYGINSAVMCKGGGTTTINGANITTRAPGANGVFSYGGNASTNATSGDGTTVVISDSTIVTTGNGSGGIMTTGQGTTNASNLKVTTSGDSSAAIRSDRGGGTVTVDSGTYTTSGTGSPAIYATATINVSNASLVSTNSQGVVNEGGNTVILSNCTVDAGNATLGSQDNFRNGVFLYQSMSGDASDGASVFSMTGGTLNNTYGHVFHVTNTSAAITLSGVSINNTDSSNVLLSVCDDAWSGLSNVAVVNAENQVLEGTVLVGSDSTATINLNGTSTWTGSTSGNITSHRDSSTISSSIGTVNVAIAGNAVWTLDADCTISSISGTGGINYNGHTLTVGSTAYSSGCPGGSITEVTGSSTTTDTSTSTTDSSTSTTDTSTSTTDSSTSTTDTSTSTADSSTSTTDSSTAATTNTSGSTTAAQTASSTAAAATAQSITISKKPGSVKATAKKNKIKITWKNFAKKTKKLKAVWKKIWYTEVQCSTSKAFNENLVTKNVKRNKSSLTLNLNRKTVYYVRIRYVSTDGVSNWSSVKRIRTK